MAIKLNVHTYEQSLWAKNKRSVGVVVACNARNSAAKTQILRTENAQKLD